MIRLPALGCPDSKNQTLPPLAKVVVENCPGIPPQQSGAVSLPAPAAPTFFGYEAHSHAHHFKSSEHFAPHTTSGTPFALNNSSHDAGYRGVLPGQPGSQMPADNAAGVAYRMLIANGINPSSLHPQQWQQFVNAPLATQQKLIATFSQFQQQEYGAQAGNPQTRTYAFSPWPTPLPHVAQQHKVEAFRFPRETHHRNQGRTNCVIKRRWGNRGKGRMGAPGECKKCGGTQTSQWRSGFGGEKLCNACGLAYKNTLKKLGSRI
ncbi:hypothetical protein MRS44_017817 [Fusarium solani]|uniref:uncharacterized protein n=1 Tax=Fusarium solani TaxID=169388 RepID=UPI0032C45BA9|nr:hypothetical protein MRS44_017817 [Fusarium solani]